MPPAKSKAQPDDSRSEASSTKEKLATSSSTIGNGKRRNGLPTNGGSSLKDVMSAGGNNQTLGNPSNATADTNPGVSTFARCDPKIVTDILFTAPMVKF
jgi:hypothetical protein